MKICDEKMIHTSEAEVFLRNNKGPTPQNAPVDMITIFIELSIK